MKRVLTSLSLLLLLYCRADAQNITQYEYWTDDDYTSRSIVNSSDNSILLSVGTEPQTAGVHFLNFRAYRNDGVWGNFYRYLYYVPTLKNSHGGNVQLEYWLDDNLVNKNRETANGGSLSLSLDVSTLAAGVHYFNCTPIASTGERGSSERYLFYVPQTLEVASVSDIKGFEYWLDDNYSAKTLKESTATTPVLAVSIDGLASGVHYFNCRAYNERGEYGGPVRKMFYIPKTQVNPNVEIAKAEYWLDDDYANKVSLNTSDKSQAFTVDISLLSAGIHYFNYRAIDSDGTTGSMIREVFYLAHSKQIDSSGLISYEYWIDDDTDNKVAGSSTSTDLVFNIDVSKLDSGTHHFNFRAKNVLDQWGETFTTEFTLSEVTAVDTMKSYQTEVHDVFNMAGFKLINQATVDDLKTLPKGIYIFGGKKVLVP